MAGRARPDTKSVEDDIPPLVPRLGDEFRLHDNGTMQYLKVTSTEWDEESGTVTIVLGPAVTEVVDMVDREGGIVVQDTNPYQRKPFTKEPSIHRTHTLGAIEATEED